MPDRDFIHSTDDVHATLRYAMDNGFRVRLDEPEPKAEPRILTENEIFEVERGSFYFIRPEWIFGEFQIQEISGGLDRGKFSVSPGVNHASFSIYFQGERLDGGRRRFGDCTISFNREWLEMPAQILRPIPPEVELWFKRFCKLMSSGMIIKAGVHKYHISKGVIADANTEQCLPPFDWIPWGMEQLNQQPRK